MKKLIDKVRLHRNSLCLMLILIAGAVVRVWEYGSIPAGFNQDEAYAAYEAYSLLNFGVDSYGYAFPCYFISWGSGMNALGTYLAMPFMAVFGYSEWVYRLPQLLCSLASLYVFYLLGESLFNNKKYALIGLFLLAVCPWHMMMSRWGLESNLAPHFILFGFYFLVKSKDKDVYLIPAAICYGTSLYAYAITWLVVPATVVLCGIYLLIVRVKLRVRVVVPALAILFVMSTPLLLFMLVNRGAIPEIRTDFFSVPKLVVSRESTGIEFENIFSLARYRELYLFLKQQNDGIIWNVIPQYGLFYKFSIPFIFIGIAGVISNCVYSLIKRKFTPCFLVLIASICAVVGVVTVTDWNVNRTNVLHYYSLIYLLAGFVTIMELFGKIRNMDIALTVRRVIAAAVITGYGLSFVIFGGYYFNEYPERINREFLPGMKPAVEYAKASSEGQSNIYVDMDICYGLILWYDKTPAPEYKETVIFNNYPNAFMNVKEFGDYEFKDYNSYIHFNGEAVHIIRMDKTEMFTARGFTVQPFGNVGVAYIQN